MKRDNFLDCIRALAVFFVVCRHGGLLPGGSIGVSLFFCLSGFLIATMLLLLEEVSARIVGDFIFRRFMRIWPMMAFQLALVTVLLAAFGLPDQFSIFIERLPGLLAFTSPTAITSAGTGLSVGVLWSLQAEFWFYITMAVTVLIAGRAPLPWIAAIGFCAAWLGKFEVISLPLYAWRTALSNLDELMIGVLCAWAIDYRIDLVRKVFSNRILCLWTPFAAVLALSTFQLKNDLAWYLAMSFAAYLTAPVILHQFAKPLSGDFEPLAYLGRISYSIYLMHAVIFEFVSPHLFPPALQFLFLAGLSVVVSGFTYKWIEQPFIRWSRTKFSYVPARA